MSPAITDLRCAAFAVALHALSVLPAFAQCSGDLLRHPGGTLRRYGHAIAYHSGEQRVFVYGGAAEWRAPGPDYRSESYRDTQVWTGSAWTRIHTNGPYEGPGAAMVYDEARQQMLLVTPFGGLFAWSDAGWSSVPGGNTYPPRFSPALAYHAGRETVMLFGGSNGGSVGLNDLWEWNGSRWSAVTLPGGPPPAVNPVMAYDAARDRLAIISYQAHYELSGTTWIRRLDAPTLSGYASHGLFFDPGIGRLLLVLSGADGWRGTTVFVSTDDYWFGVTRRDPPFGAPIVHTAFDPRRSTVFAIGGYCGSYCTLDATDEFAVPGFPSFIQHPSATHACYTAETSLAVRTQFVAAPTHQWRKLTASGVIDLTDGLTPSGATIIGSTTATLRILRPSPAEAGDYFCLVTGPCGSRASLPATITVCTADFTCDGSVDFFDYLDFIAAFEQGCE
jgi:hypothetical protein